jgi:hypothetical protein
MPVSWTAVFRVALSLLIAAYVFFWYAFARMRQEMVGLDFATVLASASFALVMLVPLAPATALPDVPVLVRSELGRRRWRQGRCAVCGHSLLEGRSGTCPECGAERAEPEFRLGWGTVRRFAALSVVAWAIGCTVAESWTWMDESSFAREAPEQITRDVNHYSRARRWPMGDRNLYYSRADGVTAYAPRLVLPQPSAQPVASRRNSTASPRRTGRRPGSRRPAPRP